MKRFYSIVAILCLALVACESAKEGTDTRGDKVDKEFLSIEELIVEQNGEFNDDQFMEALLGKTFEAERQYLMNEEGAWELYWELNEERNLYGSHYVFSENTFTINRVHRDSYIRHIEDAYIYDDYDYSYDAATNMLITNSYYDGNVIAEGEKQVAEVVYFDNDIVVLDGSFLGCNLSKSSMWRTVLKIHKEVRDNIICIDKYVAEPQDVDSEKIFAKMEECEMAIYDCMIIEYSEYSDQWDLGVAGNFIDSFKLKGDSIIYHSTGFDGEYYDVTYECAVVRDVENDALYVKHEGTEAGIMEETLKAIYADDRFVFWRRDIVYNYVDKAPEFRNLIIVCEYK